MTESLAVAKIKVNEDQHVYIKLWQCNSITLMLDNNYVKEERNKTYFSKSDIKLHPHLCIFP